MDIIDGIDSLRHRYAPPMERAVLKSLRKLDQHCRRFIELSPFLCLGTQCEGSADVAPRGDRPGFVHVLDDTTLAIPDWPGNNRLDSLTNILSNPSVGLLFLIPGVEETLRVNGTAAIATDTALLARWEVNGKHPKSVLLVTVSEAFLHCGKALIRSKLWHDDYKVERSALPSYGKMLKDQIEVCDTAEEIEKSVAEHTKAGCTSGCPYCGSGYGGSRSHPREYRGRDTTAAEDHDPPCYPSKGGHETFRLFRGKCDDIDRDVRAKVAKLSCRSFQSTTRMAQSYR